MKIKQKNLIICILLLVLALAATLAGACSGQKNAEEIARENGATVKITLDLAGGSSNEQQYRYLYIRNDSPIALPWEELGGKGIINPPSKEGFRLDGFYHGEKDEEGNITYGAKWERSERFSQDTTLYAKWVRPFVYRVYIRNGTAVKDFPVTPGEKFDSAERSAAKVDGYTFIAYYKDKDLTVPWDEDFVHPGYPDGVTEETAQDGDYVVAVYAKYVEGDFKKVYKPSDFTVASNYWLIGENGVLDFEGKNFPVLRQFTGKLVGNGVVIKNVNLSRENATDGAIGLFGALNGAQISNVTFENCSLTVKYTRRPQGVSVVKVGFMAGSAQNASLTDVTFTNCSLTVDVAKSAQEQPVVPCEYEDANPLWANRADDEANAVVLTNVNGNIALSVL